MFGYSGATAVSVGIALSQIGEFSFVLLSRAQALSLVSHKVYLLLMGTTALSLFLTPFSFKLVIWIVTREVKLKGKDGFNPNGHAPSAPGFLISPHVMTSHRDNDHVRLRLKPSSFHDDGADEHDEKLGPSKMTNGTKSLNGNQNGSSRGSPKTPGGGKASVNLATIKTSGDGLAKSEKESSYSPSHVLKDVNQVSVVAWKNTQEHTTVAH